MRYADCPNGAAESQLICSNCTSPNAEGRKFCLECGSRLAAGCPSCGSANEAGAKFCGECGTSLSTGDAPQPPLEPVPSGPAIAAPTAERRVVSVLFADLVGFTTLAQDRDSEVVRDLLTRYFDTARDIVELYGGVVEKFIGDAVMAVWGSPIAHEDDAERAVRAALDLVTATKTLGVQPGAERLELRAGVLTGEAAVTLGAQGQGMVAGDLVNTASRLQSVAPPGSVLVGDATQRASSGAIVFEPAGEKLLKGKTSPVPAFRALRIVAKRGGAGRSEGLEAPFVGREDELRLLKELFHATARERKARLVSITGQAGIGKSRMAWEFLKYVDGLAETVYWHQGRSPAFGEGVTFWALGEMVRRRAGLLETDDEATTRERISEMLDDWMRDVPERGSVERALLALLSLAEAPSGGREELFAAWRLFFQSIAQRGPVILLFEDIHWADDGLLDFIDDLLEWSRDRAIYIVTLARPELLERRSSFGAGRRNFLALSLEPLSEPAMREMLSGLVPGLPTPAIRSILDRADGVPLYAVETVRMLVAEGRLEASEGVYRPTGDLTRLAVPESLHALIAARLDSLDPPDRALLQDGSVLGQIFSVGALSVLNGEPPESLEPRLRSLVRRELLSLDADPRSPERGQYGFTQGLIREVAYATLAKRDRRARHLAAARYFEALGDEEIAGALASHYLDAYRASPEGPEADGVRVQARLALRGAGDRAARLGSYDQAITYLEQALTVTSDAAEETELLERIGHSAEMAGRYTDAEAALRRAVESHRARGDGTGVARASAELAKTLLAGRRTPEAIKLLESAHEESAGVVPDEALIELLAQLARAYMFHEDLPRSLEWADRALVAAERLDVLPVIADTLITKGLVLANQGRLQEGIGLLEAGDRLGDESGLAEISLRARVNLSGVLPSIDYQRASAVGQAGFDLARRLGQRSIAVVMLVNAAEVALPLGDWDWAVAEVDNFLSLEMDPSDRVGLLAVHIELHALRGDPIAETMAQLESLVGDGQDVQQTTALLLARVWAATAAGRPDEAYHAATKVAEGSSLNAPAGWILAGRAGLLLRDPDRVRAALSALDQTGVRGPALSAQQDAIAAGLAALEGRPSEAIAGFQKASRRLRELGVSFDLALYAFLAVSLLGADDDETRALANEAAETFASLGARPLATQLDEVLAGSSTRTTVAVTRPEAPVPTSATAVPTG
ncbi:MAG: AAA family ATPase [Chloroflexi bacterium]|nr:AAA family ATPase [Chloroflexota bacterium]